MAWRAKCATVLLIDVGPSMSKQAFAGDQKLTKGKKALALALACYQRKLFFTPKEEVGIVLFGSDVTKNGLHETAEDGYNHVHVARDNIIDTPDLEALKFLLEAQPGHMAADALDGLIVAIDMLSIRCGKGKYRPSIHLFTDEASIAAGDPDFEAIREQLDEKEKNIKLSITLLGSTAEPWRTLVANHAQIAIVSVEEAEREWSICSKPVEQRAKVRLSLEISPDVQIPVGIYGRTTSARMPGLKKRSRVAATAMSTATPGEQRVDKVIVERTYHVADDDAGEEVKPEDRIKGHKYGQNTVPMSEYDEASLMYTCERTLRTLGFAPASCLAPEHSTYHIETVAADKGDRCAFTAIESLVSAMVTEERVLIARYCFRKNALPRVVALVPQLGDGGANASFLNMQYLPFADDIREWTFASLPQPTPEQRSVVSALVDAMDLDAIASQPPLPAKVGAESSKVQEWTPLGEVLRPDATNSPALSRFYAFLANKAVDPAARMPAANFEHSKGMVPLERIVGVLETAKCAEVLASAFSLERVEKNKGKKAKRFWREAIAEKRKEASFAEVDTKRIKVDAFKKDEKEEDKVKVQDAPFQVGGAASSSMAMAVPFVPMEAPRVEIRSVHPEKDFERWLAYRVGGHDTVGPAIDQMKSIIDSLIEASDDHHGKALSCLSALRSGCVREGEVLAFNNFARVLRAGKTARKVKFWPKARDAGLGLITDGEAPTSTVTAEESRAFLAGEETYQSACSATPAQAAPAQAISEQALEDMIE